MSGPKCVDLGPDRRTLERERNTAACETALSELTRLEADWQRLAQRLEALNLLVERPPYPTEEVVSSVRHLLAVDRDAEAAAKAEVAARAWRAAAQSAEERLTSRIFDLQNRFRRLAEHRAGLVAAVTQLEAEAHSSTAASWPRAVQERVAKLIRETLGEASIPAPVEPQLDRTAIAALEGAERELERSERALTTGRDSLVSVLENAHDDALRAAFAGDQPHERRIDEWVQLFAAAPAIVVEEDQSEKKIERLLAAVATLSDSGVWGELLREADQVRSEPDKDRRRLLFENLSIRCSHELNRLRRMREHREAIALLIDRAAAWKSPEVDALVEELQTMHQESALTSFADLDIRLSDAIKREQRRRQSAARRKAVMESLQSLGYSPVEGLGTGTIQQGRLVFQRADETEYAVEVVTNDDASVVQTALVRFADSTEITSQQRLRDVEREQAWCDDHAAVRQELTARGWPPHLKVALKPGERSVRVVVDSAASRRRRGVSQARTQQVRNP